MENPTNKIADQIKTIQQEHEAQFEYAAKAALREAKDHPGFYRWLDNTWHYANACGARPQPFISAMFVFLTSALVKKFLGSIPKEDKLAALTSCISMFRAYLDQVEQAAQKKLDEPEPAVTSKSNIIMPKKEILQ